jgi:hypothetical protein
MKHKQVTIIDAIKSPRIFGPLFPNLTSWFSWTVFLKSVFGLPMNERELEVFRNCTNRTNPPRDGVREVWCLAGRRAGKSRIVSFAAVYIACFHDFPKYLVAGERGVVLVLSRDRDQSKVIFNYVSAILNEVKALKAMIVRQTVDEIELVNNIVIKVGTSDYRPVRGVTVVCSLNDETCFWDSAGASPGHGDIPGAKASNVDDSVGQDDLDIESLCTLRPDL